MKTLSVCLLLVVVGASARATNQPLPVVTVTPEYITQLAEQLRTNSPALLAAQARSNAASAGVRAVRTWEDPMVMLGGMFAEEMMRADEGDIMYGVEQKLPLFGRPAAARQVARAELAVAGAESSAEFQMRRSQLAIALFRAARAEEIVRLGEADLHWLAALQSATEARYRSGEASLTESLQIQNEHSRRKVALETDRDQRTQRQAGLNRLLNRSLLQAWPVLKLPAPAGRVTYTPRLAEFASKFEPRLHAMREEVRAANAMAEMTRRERFPEVSLGAVSRNFSGDGEWRQAELAVRFSLPWFNRNQYRSAIARDEAKVRAAEWQAADYAASLQEEVHGLTLKIEAARREALAYRDDIIPRSEAAEQSARAAWEAGRGMFRDVLEAHRMLVEARLMHIRAVAEQYEMLSDLVLCCGLGDLEALGMIGAEAETQVDQTKP